MGPKMLYFQQVPRCWQCCSSMQNSEKMDQYQGFPGSASGKESTCQYKRCRYDPWVGGRCPGGGNSLQYSCLENPMDRGAQRATVHGVTESDTTEHKWISPTQSVSWASVQPLRLLSICHKTSTETESINIYGNMMSNLCLNMFFSLHFSSNFCCTHGNICPHELKNFKWF